MKILAVNCGSSSLKFSLYEMPEEKVLLSGTFERIGLKNSFYTLKKDKDKKKIEVDIPNHKIAVKYMNEAMLNEKVIKDLSEIKGVGHRIVQGADYFKKSCLLGKKEIAMIKELSPLAPLHNPNNLVGINMLLEKLPKATPVGVFDTSFHQTLKEEQYLYPIPYAFYLKHKIRKYGAHGTSHRYLMEEMKKFLHKDKVNLITCHIGNGVSITAIKDSESFDTSMGFTPNAGTMMGTRCGDIDFTFIPYLMKEENLTLEEVIDILNNKSGLLGISESSSDSRDIEDSIKNGDHQAIIAQKMYVDRISEYIAKYYITMGGKCDAIVFTAGVGENSISTRKEIIKTLEPMGLILDEEANEVRGKFQLITKKESKIPCYILPTDEEVMIARDTYSLVK